MSNTLGNNLKLTIFGESHSPYIGATLDGLSSGIKINQEAIKNALDKRRPQGVGETKRIENDDFEIISGVFNGYTTGKPLTILIKNNNINSNDYEDIKDMPRPSHADYTAYMKYHGFNDYRGGGAFSGRLTATIVAMGAICNEILKSFNIIVKSHIKSIGDIIDKDLENIEEIQAINNHKYHTINNLDDELLKLLDSISKEQDSIGGIIQTVIFNMPPCLGGEMFDSIEGMLSKAMFAIGSIKGIEFGKGFKLANMKGSIANDNYQYQNGKVITLTNNNGGINGGISNGMPISFNVVIKATPSIGKEQKTVNLRTKENTTIKVQGRHDPCIVRRINEVVEKMTAIVILDLLYMRYGNDIDVIKKVL